MIGKGKQEVAQEFKDTLFLSKLQILPDSHDVPPLSKFLSKLTKPLYANKIVKRQNNKNRKADFQKAFEEQQNTAPLPRKLKMKSQDVSMLIPYKNNHYALQREKGVVCDSPRVNSHQAHHFNVSRNVYNEDIHEDLTKSGILMEKLQWVQEMVVVPRMNDARYFLKQLKIKNNHNLYKGNFTKFKKRDITHRYKTKVTAHTFDDLSPWDQDKNQSQIH